MNKKLRSVNTHFWNDSFIQELTSNEKLLFLYFLTNPLTNILGIYEITLKRISFDTGITINTIEKTLEHFERLKKVFYISNFIILPNFLKNQSMNTKMKIGAINIFFDLPEKIKQLFDFQEDNIDFDTLSYAIIHFDNKNMNKNKNKNMNSNIKIEKNIDPLSLININRSKEKKRKIFTPPTLNDVKIYFEENDYPESLAIKAYNYYNIAGWKDAKGNQVKNWKQKMISVWFREENKEKVKEIQKF